MPCYNRSMIQLRLIGLLIALGAMVGCVADEPTSTPDIPATVAAAVKAALSGATITPTLDIEATVEARLRATVEAMSTLTPTPSATSLLVPPMPTSTREPTLTPIHTPTLTPTLIPTPSIQLQAELPRNVWEKFYAAFYDECPKPQFDSLKVMKTWTNTGNSEVEFTLASETYFLAVGISPTDPIWEFDSVLDTSTGKRFQSLHLDSTVPDDVVDAQAWCQSGFGIALPDVLHIESRGLRWTLYLVSSAGLEPLPRPVAGALAGFYGVCPPMPSIEEFRVVETWTSQLGITGRSLEFIGSPPHFILGVKFKPEVNDWYFRSVNISGDWRSLGPNVSSSSGETINFTATCPSTSSPHHLDVEADGGSWSVYLIGVR